jgi:nucleotide-binding universal stress UspA family protein
MLLEETMYTQHGGDVASHPHPPLQRILVAVDGSPASLRAVQLAINQVKSAAGTSLVLVNVQNFGTLGLPEGAGIMSLAWIEQEEMHAAAQTLQDAVNACQQAGVAYAARADRGPVAATIDRVAREEGVTNIFMGTRGLGEVRGLLVGSVATRLLHLADAPVTLVK